MSLNRRDFLGASAAGLGYFYTADAISAVRAADKPSEKIRIAGIGIGGKGSSDIDQAGEVGEVVALCDIDANNLSAKLKKFPKAEQFFDYRILLEKLEKSIDAVVVSTPDHTHALPSLTAMRMKKHVYCQKPLTHSIFEARLMRETAKKMGVATQMGNQGTAENGLRRAAEIIQAGTIGAVTEIHVWTNRPIWPQAPQVMSRPKTADVPKHVHWDEFLGGAPERPYAPGYHPFGWRGWLDFGTGALGDMACHTANMAFMACKLGYPTAISADATDVNQETFSSSAKIEFDFPARDEKFLPACKLFWYEGKRDGKKVLPSETLLKKVIADVGKLSNSGSLIVGTKGILFSPNDYGAQYTLVGPDGEKDAFTGLNLTKPESMPINGKGDQGMKIEWAAAMRGGPAAVSNFDYSGMLTEVILLGNVAIRSGKKIVWDGPKMMVTNDKAANAFVRREYRKGWDVAANV